VILHRDDAGMRLRHQLGGDAADVAESLHRHPGAFQRHAHALGSLAGGQEDAAAGRLDPAQRPAEFDRLAGDHAGDGTALVGGVGVHHPRHDLRVGVDVRRRDVLGGPDDDADLAGVAAGDLLEFVQGQLLGIDPDAALGAAIRNVDCSVLDGHPCRERQDFFQRHVLVVAHATLARSARQVVLHPVALEVANLAVVHLDRDVDDQRPLGMLERLHPTGQLAKVGCHLVDLRQVRVPGAARGRVQIREGSHGYAPSRREGHVSLTGTIRWA
jgi:hypothetical protein